MKSSLAAKIGGAMALIIVAAVSTTTLLNILRFEEAYQDFVARRLHVIAADIRRDVVFGLDLGLPLQAMDNLPDILARHIRAGDIEAITLRDCEGGIVESAGTPQTAGEVAWPSRKPPETWRRFSDETVALGVRIDNALGECAGVITVDHSAALYAAAIDRNRLRLLAAGAAGMLVAIPAFLLARRLFRRRRAVLGAIEANMTAILAGAADGGDGIDPQALPSGDTIERMVVEAYRNARPAMIAATASGKDDQA